jgi:alkylation response protein AidB-like acyl-CoA dehydrogenase
MNNPNLFPLHPAEIYDEIRTMTGKFSNSVIRPVAAELDRDETFPEEIFSLMAGQGLFGITAPEDYGGAGLDCYAYSLVMEELARGYASVADMCGMVELITSLLSEYGSPEQKERYLKNIIGFDTRVAYVITEAEAGSDVSGVKTTAARTGSGWRLSGSKVLIHNAPHADIGMVLARTDPEKGHRGMSIFIVDLNARGVSRSPKETKMGQRASHVGSLFFEDVELSPDAILGEENRGFYIMMSALNKGRVGIAALSTGIAQAGLDACISYVQERKQFGKTISENQGIQWMLADMATGIQASRSLVKEAALLIDHGRDATLACSMAKCFASDNAVKQTAEAVQIFGGGGYIRGMEVERLYRDAKVTQIYEGTNQIQRNIIARELIKQNPIG